MIVTTDVTGTTPVGRTWLADQGIGLASLELSDAGLVEAPSGDTLRGSLGLHGQRREVRLVRQAGQSLQRGSAG
jgi:hypothetical protein